MALERKKQKSTNEATVVLTLNITDIVRRLPSDEKKANELIDWETNRLIGCLQQMPGVDNIDIQKKKIFLNIKDSSDTTSAK